MAKSIPAQVTPEVLIWARKLDDISINEIAAKMKLPPERIESWEKGETQPTLVQAKELAKQYRIPFVYFYLPDTPKKEKRIEATDYRTFGNIGDHFIVSRELRWLLRDVEDRRDLMLSLYNEEEKEPEDFPLHVDADVDEDDIAGAIREFLELDADKQKTFRKPEVALKYCIAILEKHDVLVFQAKGIDADEMRGLSIAYDQMPIIVLNRKDEYSARLFTLCHELVHVITRTSGLCNDISENSRTQKQIEIKCNQIVGKVLVPLDRLCEHQSILEIQEYGFDDARVAAIARDFAVSKEVILHALWEQNIITKDFYFETLDRYSEEYLKYKNKKSGGGVPPAIDKGTQVGRLYAQTVLEAYHTEKITARDTSQYLLNLKTQHFSRLERWCF